ncbi:UNVERIFIED_CONTAM: peptidyl-tRNA hydrolase domain-containing protein 1 [Siphonaria sp. JEL0065]|nr:peptidyl-tRNA hydrolase domain-containing protein 1 [Siphonaria sp. JEL0065]
MPTTPTASPQAFLTVFIIVRKDLAKTLNWPMGAVIGNACHAATAVLHKYRDEQRVIEYMADLEGLRKVVMETKNEGSLEKVEAALKEKGLLYHKWVEQPEGIPAAIATAPYFREDVQDCLKKCQLFR